MQFQHPNGLKVNIYLPARSLLVMKDEARYMWTHFIPLRTFDLVVKDTNDLNIMKLERQKRISCTFRTVRGRKCDCKFVEQCDRI